MGGDHAPRSVLKGANIARRRWPEVCFLLVGDKAKLKPILKRMPRLRKVSDFIHTDAAIAADEKPAVALRSGRESSMRLAIDAVRDGKAEGVVSAGNTGALMAMSKFSLKTILGIDRPAMASFYPTLRGESVMLDLGANIQCTSTNLVQFAVMGEVFARSVLGSLKPSVGLLNVGSEDLKGNDTVRDAASVLKDFGPDFNFHGFIEGTDIAEGTVDVVVADGFSGNISIKTAEGTAKLYTRFLRDAFRSLGGLDRNIPTENIGNDHIDRSLGNIGSEDLNGNDTVRDAASVLKDFGPDFNFHGFIEGTDIAEGTVDVVVADGFSGNISIKTAEGTAKLYTRFLRDAFRSSLLAGVGYLLARRALKKLRTRVDPRRYNGAMFLGLRGISVKAHGGSDALAFATAIGVAVDMAKNGFVDQIKAELERYQDPDQRAVRAVS